MKVARIIVFAAALLVSLIQFIGFLFYNYEPTTRFEIGLALWFSVCYFGLVLFNIFEKDED